MTLGAAQTRWGVFGGAFDPPHQAHLGLITTAIQQLGLDRLLVVPTGEAWHKSRVLSPAADRLAMARLAFGHMPQVEVDDRETRRVGPSFTIDSLLEIKAENPGAALFLLIGGDQARNLASWQRWRELIQIAIICVAERDDETAGSAAFVPPDALKDRFLRLKMPPNTVSATQIRAKVARREGVDMLVGGPVARYIAQYGLYTQPSA